MSEGVRATDDRPLLQPKPTREDVQACYHLILGRPAEDEAAGLEVLDDSHVLGNPALGTSGLFVFHHPA